MRWSLLVLLVACGKSAQSDPRVHALTLPLEQPASLPNAQGRTEVLASCTPCHETRYITGQPRLARKTWQAEVDKMRTAYGAPVPADDAPKIVDYLATTFGSE